MAREPKSRAKNKSKSTAVELARVPTPQEIERLKSWAATTLDEAYRNDPDDARDAQAAALVLVLLGTGARRFECAAFKVKDFFTGPDGPVARFRTAKGGKSGVLVPLTSETWIHVQRWLRFKGNPGPEAPLFEGLAGEHMALPTLWRAWRHALRAAGIVDGKGQPKYGVHASRHAGAFLVMRATKSYADVKRFLRHASVKTTENFYEHFDLGDIRAALGKAGL